MACGLAWPVAGSHQRSHEVVMRRFTALILVASLSLQAAGCTTTSAPALPTTTRTTVVTQTAPVIGGAPRTSRAATLAAQVHEPSIPATEAWGGQAGGLVVGLGLVGLIVLGILVGGRDSDGNSSGGGTTPGLAAGG